MAQVTGRAGIVETTFLLEEVQLDVHIFQLQPDDEEYIQLEQADDHARLSRVMKLPSVALEGLWDS